MNKLMELQMLQEMNLHTRSRKGRCQKLHPPRPPLEDIESTETVKLVTDKNKTQKGLGEA